MCSKVTARRKCCKGCGQRDVRIAIVASCVVAVDVVSIVDCGECGQRLTKCIDGSAPPG